MKVENSIMHAVFEQLKKDKEDSPNFPQHICGQVATIAEHLGGMHAAAMALKYRKGKEEQKEKLRQDTIKTIAAGIRLLENL